MGQGARGLSEPDKTKGRLAPPLSTSRIARSALKRDDFSSNRHPALGYCWSMMFSENRYPLFGIML
jgi:hypothetical protein